MKTIERNQPHESARHRGLGQRRAAVLLFGALLLHCFNSGAVAFRLPNQDPEAIARGDAFAATADNPSAIYYNPAGIAQLEGQNLRMGLYLISPGLEYEATNGAVSKADSNFEPVPQLYYVDSFTNAPLAVGLGIYAPYGLSLDWGNDTPFSTVAESGKLLYLCFNPVVAWRVSRSLAIGIGPTINYSQATFERAIGLFPGDQFKFEGDALGYGFNAGILWQPHPKWSFGVNYRYGTTLNYDGTSSTTPSPPLPASSSTTAEVNFPQFVVGGISFRPTPDWNLEFDLDWTEWSEVKQIVFKNTAFGDVPVTLDYRSSFIYEFGVTRQLGKGYFASVGYIYSENSSPDANFNPLIPDSDLHLGSVGFGHHGKHWDWAAAYHFGYNGGRTVENNANPQTDGTYSTFNNGFNLALTLKF